MCLDQNIEYFSSNVPINFGETNLEWPIHLRSNITIIACDLCLYPVTLQNNIIDTITNESNEIIAIIIPITKLFSKNTIINENFLNQWKTTISCLNCSTIQTYTNYHLNRLTTNDAQKIISYTKFGPQITIFNPELLRQDSLEKIRNEYVN